MLSSVANCIKLFIPKTKRRMKTLERLNWRIKLFIVLLICTIIIIILTYPKGPTTRRNRNSENVTNLRGKHGGELSQKEILILQWTSFWGVVWPAILFNTDTCSILKTGTTQQPPISQLFDIPCRITYDQRHLRESHAVVFHNSDMFYTRPYSNLPTTPRPQNQIWVWFETEAPVHRGQSVKALANIFNWTMTYRRDSDVYYPYGYIFQRNNSTNKRTFPVPSLQDNPADHHRNSLKTKTGLVAWIVSTCTTPSNREYFVEELQKYIPVDSFGKCGKYNCSHLQDKGYFICYNHIQSKYKFIFAFENSLCLDYVTEKFYLALQTDMVPVVYGGGIDNQMDYLSIAPQNSFIDARKFESPEELANYLIYLHKNDEEYLKYFEWKAKYQVIYKDYGQMGLGWCNLCQRVFEQMKNRDEKLRRWYSDLYTWWNYTSELNTKIERLPLASQSKRAVSPLGQTFQVNGQQLKSTCVRARFKAYFKAYSEPEYYTDN